MRAAKNAPRDPFQFLERRHGPSEVVERGVIVPVERPRKTPPHPKRGLLLDKYPLVRWEITGIAEKRLRESTLLQVVPKEQTRLPSSACLSQSFSYHADLLEDDGDGLRTPPGARGGAGQLI